MLIQHAINQIFNFTPPPPPPTHTHTCEDCVSNNRSRLRGGKKGGIALRRLFAALFLICITLPVAADGTWETYYDQAEAFYAGQEYLSAEQAALTAMTKVEALQKDPQTADTDAEADCANLLALIYVRLGYFDRAAQYATRCNEIDRASGNADNIASSYNTLAGIYMADNRPDQAVACIQQALSYCAQVNNPPRMAVLCGMASEAYHAADDERLSLYYAQRAYAIEDSLGRTDKAAIRLAQQALPLINLHRYKEAHDVLSRALPVLKESGNDHSYAIACNQMGRLLHAECKEQEAAQYFMEAQAIFAEQHDIYNLSQAQNALREVSVAYERRAHRRDIIIALALFLILALITVIIRSRHQRRLMALTFALEQQQQHLDNSRKVIAERVQPESDENALFMQRFVAAADELLPQGQCSQERIAEQMHVSVSTLRRRVTEATGELPKSYITVIQMQKAAALLREQRPLGEIADLCGFSDASSLSHAFKRFYGFPPSQFKG